MSTVCKAGLQWPTIQHLQLIPSRSCWGWLLAWWNSVEQGHSWDPTRAKRDPLSLFQKLGVVSVSSFQFKVKDCVPLLEPMYHHHDSTDCVQTWPGRQLHESSWEHPARSSRPGHLGDRWPRVPHPEVFQRCPIVSHCCPWVPNHF